MSTEMFSPIGAPAGAPLTAHSKPRTPRSCAMPIAYGSDVCSTHDAVTVDCAVVPAPGFCAESWCYVDPLLCRE